MNSNEEYLDNLLKALTEGGNATGGNEAEEKFVNVVDGAGSDSAVTNEIKETEIPATSAGTDKSMTPEAIEAMLASMGGDSILSEEPAPKEPDSEEFALDESHEEEGIADDFALEESSLEDMEIEEPLPEEPDSEELALEETEPEELYTEEKEASDLALEEPHEEEEIADDFALEESPLEDMGIEEPLPEEPDSEELALEETEPEAFALEETGSEEPYTEAGEASDLALEEPHEEEEIADDFALEESSLEDMGIEETESEESHEEEGIADDFALEESSLEDMVIEEPDSAEEDETMSEEEIERLLSGESLSEEAGDSTGDILPGANDFALEETEPDAADGDGDLSALLAGMSHDEDLAEINNLLEKSDQGIAVDDDMLAMLEGSEAGDSAGGEFDFLSGGEENGADGEVSSEESEESGDSKKKKKKERKAKKEKKGRGKKKDSEADGEVSGEDAVLEGDGAEEQEPKKPGFFAKLIAFLTETDDDDEEKPADAENVGEDGLPTGTPTEENKELLQELSEEDKKNAKKKKKKDKKKGKKGEASAEGEEGEEEGEQKGKKKKKKKKKEEENPEDLLPKPPEKKLSKKKVMSVFMFCATLAACIILVCLFLPGHLQKQDARVAYDHKNYEEVYSLLYGKDLNEADEAVFQKSKIILQMQRKLDSYENFVKLDMPLEALDALVEGVDRYHDLLPVAEQYNVMPEIDEIYAQILAKLEEGYGLSEMDAIDINASGDDVTYSQRLEEIVYGLRDGSWQIEQSEVKEDVLPEEEEIIDRLEGNEGGQ